jgi:hypothetical protein
MVQRSGQSWQIPLFEAIMADPKTVMTFGSR